MRSKDPKSAKFLIIRFSAFGDVVQTLSVPSALKKTFPQAEIHWVTRKDMSPLLQGHPHINQIWELDKKSGVRGLLSLALRLRGQGFTHIYDAHNNTRSRILSWMLRPVGFLGLGPVFIRRSIRRWKRFLLFRLRINTFEMPFSGQRDLLEPLAPWGIERTLPPSPQLFLSNENIEKAKDILRDYQGAIALAPSAAHFLKRWPKEYFKELILRCPEQKFILLGGPEDSFIDDIHDVAPHRVLNLAGRCTLTDSAAVVALSAVLVTNDTWLLHAAEQLGKKAIALMGPAPFGFPSRPSTKILERDLPCRPCSKHGQGPCVNSKKYHQCLVDITPQEVIDAIKSQVGLRL